ncbi:hypothetical protein, partial [Escherichia coli]|uniref:hypothetical protein n=1 Tax=Escherichia coli TaxID=562 RepID=UPI003CED5765
LAVRWALTVRRLLRTAPQPGATFSLASTIGLKPRSLSRQTHMHLVVENSSISFIDLHLYSL